MRLYFLPKFGMRKNLKKYGSWAVVTGATDGIGKAIAKQLAKRGINIILISRSSDKLTTVAEEIGTYNVQVKTITYDFSDVSKYDEISDELKDMEIGILVNNVGISYDHPEYLLELSDEVCDTLINVDVISAVKMTRIVLSGMIQRKRGLIVHISSESAYKPIPLLSLYSSAKAFVDFFGRGVHREYVKAGIHSQVVTPSFVASNLSKMRPRGIMVPNADRFAEMAVNAFGLSSSMAGWWAHEIQAFLVNNVIPDALFYKLAWKTMNGGRKKWLRKQQQKSD